MSAANDIEQAVRRFVWKATTEDTCPCCGAQGNTDVEERPGAMADLARSVGVDIEPRGEE